MWHEIKKETHSAEMECGTFKKVALSRAELWSLNEEFENAFLKKKRKRKWHFFNSTRLN